MAQIDIKNCTFKFIDGTTPTPNTLEFKIGEGTMSFRMRRNLVFTKNRGKLDLVKIGDDVPMEVSFDVVWEFLKAQPGSANPMPYEFLTQTGMASSYKSTSADDCEPYAINIEIDDITPCTDDMNERIVLPYFRQDKIDGGFRDGMLKVTGRCNATAATATRF